MSYQDLEGLLAELPLPQTDATAGLRFSATQVGTGEHRLGRGTNGEPALLLSAIPDAKAPKRPPRIELEHMSVQHDVTCWILSPDGQQTNAPFTVVQFTGSDTQLRRYFLRIVAALIASIGSQPTTSAVQEAVRHFVELFRVLAQPRRESVQGLWAELFLLVQSGEPAALAAAWHIDPHGRYDFDAGTQRIEVKSVQGRIRRHRFSLEQLQPPADVMLLIASVLLERSAGGVSLEQLLERAHKLLESSPHLQTRIEQVVASTLGETLAQGLAVSFDWELAQQSLRFYEYAHVPMLKCDFPPEITDVSFTADMTALDPVDMSLWAGDLFASARRGK